eukprot:TRINITY_DN7989_c0_g1_i1.p1 TRINITY_DN7989_c0_g1~~TRINITY_DN7989_c0_g1_i1.p1  ORF type:complete len:1108 (+),score=301.02 TRINITY_DN7989_c0_g1_i1:88-3411(+)
MLSSSDKGKALESPTLTEVSNYLLQNNYWLTALELYQETTERGEIQNVLGLHQCFTNEEFLRDMELPPVKVGDTKNGGKKDEEWLEARVKELEWELMNERQVLRDLRNELQHNMPIDETAPLEDSDMTTFEKKTINYCVKKYLLDQGYKLTAISFTQQVADNCIDDWNLLGQLYGIQNYKPPTLKLLYRYFVGGGVNKFDFGHKEALDKSIKENTLLKTDLEKSKDAIHAAQQEIEELKNKISALEEENTNLKRTIKGNLKGVSYSDRKQLDSSYSTPVRPSPAKLSRSSTERALYVDSSGAIDDQSDYGVESNEEKILRLTKKERQLRKLLEGDQAEEHKILKVLNENTQLDAHRFVNFIADNLPRLVEGLPLERREDILAVLVLVISYHNDENTRRGLLKLLFNILPFPNEAQRNAIIAGCVWLAAQEDKRAFELLFELQTFQNQPNLQQEERLILLSDICGNLANHVSTDLRYSLLLSTLTTFLSNSKALVRESAIKNISKLLLVPPAMDIIRRVPGSPGNGDFSRKHYTDLREAVIRGLKDTSPEPREASKKLLLPIFGDWCEENNFFIIPFLSSQIKKLLEFVDAKNEKGSQDMYVYMTILRGFIPQLIECLIKEAGSYGRESPVVVEKLKELESVQPPPPPPLPTKGFISEMAITFIPRFDPRQRAVLMQLFEDSLEEQLKSVPGDVYQLAKNGFSWKERDTLNKTDAPYLYWTLAYFIPSILDIASKIDITQPDDFFSIIKIISDFVVKSCPFFINRTFIPEVEKRLSNIKDKFQDNRETRPEETVNLILVRIRLTILYICGVLINQDKQSALLYLRKLTEEVAMKENFWTENHYSVVATCMTLLCHLSPTHVKDMMDLLNNLNSHPEHQVRALIPKLVSAVAREVVSPEEVESLIQVLTKLSADHQKTVKNSTISSFGDIAAITMSPQALEKIKVHMNTLLQTADRKTQREFLRTFTRIIPNVEGTFRDSFIIPEIFKITQSIGSLKKVAKKKRLVALLVPAFLASTEVQIDNQIKLKYILPGLEIIKQQGQILDQSEKYQVNEMINDIRKPKPLSPKSKEKTKENLMGNFLWSITTLMDELNKNDEDHLPIKVVKMDN